MTDSSKTEWSSVVPTVEQIIGPKTVDSLIRGFGRISMGGDVYRGVLSGALDTRHGETLEVTVRYQQFGTTGGYHLGYSSNIEGGRCGARRVTFVGLDTHITQSADEGVLAQEQIRSVFHRAACRDYGILVIEKRQTVKVVLVSFLAGLSYGKRSHVGSMVLADFLMSQELCYIDVFTIIREQAAANYFTRMGNLTQVSKVMVVSHHCIEWTRQHTKAVGTLLFATYYVGFLIKGGRRGTRNLLEVLRMSYPGSLFDLKVKHTLPLPHFNTMDRICPPNLAWTMNVGDEAVRVSNDMTPADVKKIGDCLRAYYSNGFVRLVTAKN